MIDPLSAAGLIAATAATAAWWRERRARRRIQSSSTPEEVRFSELLERLGVGHWVRNLETGEMWWSHSFRRQHGIADDVPAARSQILAILLPEDRDRFVQELENAYARGEGEITYRSSTATGDIHHHVVRIAIETSPSTGQRLAYGFNLDVSTQVNLQRVLQERTTYLEAIVRQLPMGLSVFDADLKLRAWNAEFAKVLELPEDVVHEGVDFAELIRVPARRGEYGPGDVDTMVNQRRELALRFQAHRFERARPNGRTHLVIGEPVMADGKVIGFVTTYTDITEQKQERERLEQTRDMLRTLIEHIPAGITMVDKELRLLAWNDRLREILDFPPELFEQPVVTLESLFRYNVARGEYGDTEDPETIVQGLVERSLTFAPHVFERTRPNGRVLHIQGQPLATGGFVTVYTDITERKQAEAEIKRLARTDPLTGLDNRGAFTISLAQALAQAERSRAELALLFIDMDRFKAVNDSLGHETGDAVLRETARRLRERLRASDVVARIGGDEFVVALGGIDEPVDAAQVACQIVAALSAPFSTERGEIFLSPSIGIALYPQDAREENELLRLADLAMYHAKSAGGAAYQFYTESMNAEVHARIDFETRLRQAVRDGAFQLHFQPIHRLSAGLPLSGFEALLRWPDGQGGYIPPDRFIPIAEESDLIDTIGEWVCRAAARQLKQWRRTHTVWPFQLGINLSARQFDSDDLAQRLQELFAEEGLDLNGIEFEITEGAMMRDPGRTQAQLDMLRKMGARCSVDDFGTGHSSLSYIKHFAIDRLKIDKSFVHDLGKDRDDEAIVSAAIGLAHRLGREIVAEGVETEEQLSLLKALGCDAVQGYLFSPPMPPSKIASYLERVTRGAHQPGAIDSA